MRSLFTVLNFGKILNQAMDPILFAMLKSHHILQFDTNHGKHHDKFFYSNQLHSIHPEAAFEFSQPNQMATK